MILGICNKCITQPICRSKCSEFLELKKFQKKLRIAINMGVFAFFSLLFGILASYDKTFFITLCVINLSLSISLTIMFIYDNEVQSILEGIFFFLISPLLICYCTIDIILEKPLDLLFKESKRA